MLPTRASAAASGISAGLAVDAVGAPRASSVPGWVADDMGSLLSWAIKKPDVEQRV